MRVLRLALLAMACALALGACSSKGDKSSPSPNDQAAPPPPFTRDQFVKLEVDAQCALLKDDGDPGDIDDYRDAELKKLSKTKSDYFLSLKQYMDDASVRSDIEAQTDDCRRKAGWVEKTGPDGQKTWERTAQ